MPRGQDLQLVELLAKKHDPSRQVESHTLQILLMSITIFVNIKLKILKNKN